MRSSRALTAAILLLAACAASGQDQGYAGSQTCQICHEDIYNAFMKSAHSAVEASGQRGRQGRACESCHGPAAKHAESTSVSDVRNPARISPAAGSRVCLTCHLHASTQAGRIESSHAKDAVACTACHTVHANGGAALVARQAAQVNQQCAACHVNVMAQFRKPFHHRLPESAMSCVDCHNPHGSLRAASLHTFAGNDTGCFRCHGEKRGPFAFEHAPLRFESCAACHEPHGSTNPRMLTRHEVRFVCLECHANRPASPMGALTLGITPPAFHDLLSPRFQNCTICHQKVHGSHIDRNLLR